MSVSRMFAAGFGDLRMRTLQAVAVLVVAVVAFVAGPTTASGAQRSPHLYPLRFVLERLRAEHADDLSPAKRRIIRHALAHLDAEGRSPRSQLRALRRIVPLWRQLGSRVQGGVLDDAIRGFLAEFEGQHQMLAARVGNPGSTAGAARRAAARALRSARRSLDAAAGRSASRRSASLSSAYAQLLVALDHFGRVDDGVEFVWTTCDSVGPIGTPYVSGVNCRVTLHDGYPRRFVVYVPAAAVTAPGQPTPVVVMFHGTGGTGEQFLNHSGWREKADEVGLIAVFPTSLEYFLVDWPGTKIQTRWNGFSLPYDVDLDREDGDDDVDAVFRSAGYPASAPFPADDIGFTRRFLADLSAPQSGLVIDADRVFVSGFSNGAQFTSRCMVEMADVFAAAGFAAGWLDRAHCADGVTPDPVCPSRLMPAFAILGTDDAAFLFLANEGLASSDPGYLTSIPLDPAALDAVPLVRDAFVNFTLDTLRLDRTPVSEQQLATHTARSWTTPLAGNTSGNSFTFVVMDGVTHTYPHGFGYPDENPRGFSAPNTFWTFFAANPRP